jgi:protein O-GlcNAc transferase
MTPGTSPADDLERLLQQGVECHRTGRLPDAETLYRRVLAQAPDHPGALHYLGLLAMQTGHLPAAEELLARAAKLTRGAAEVLNNWGMALARLGRLEDARDKFTAAITRDAALVDAYVNLGNVLADTGEHAQAEERYRAAIRLAPRSVGAHNNLGRLLAARRRTPEAVAAFEAALAIDPRHGNALMNLGNALRDQGKLREALARYRAAQAVRPNDPEAFSNLLLALNCDPEPTPDEIFAAHREFAARFEQPLRAQWPVHPRRARTGRLRVGYVSPDFRAHAAAAFIEPLFAHHDRSRVEVTAYYNAWAEDETTQRIKGLADRFVTIAGWSDAQFAQAVGRDAIDILVDLSGHSGGNRLLAFARKPAPVQVTWLGYLNTTGLEAMDYRLTDARADPPGATERWHTELLARLPASLWCYRPWDVSPDVGPSPAARNTYVTFGSTNNPAKLTADALAAWAQIMARVPASRLHMHAPDDADFRARLLAAFRAQGVDATRITFFARVPAAEYLAQYTAIDLALDTFPCCGGTTTFDALWMGVPVVSWAQARPFSRGGASILGNLGLEECVAATREEYIESAVRLASDGARLAELRAQLRPRLSASALVDGERFARAVEDAYETMWDARGAPAAGPV